MARIAVFGAGYVGLVTAAALAKLGNDVVVRDVVPEKIDRLNGGEVPIFEPGLEETIAENAERLSFTLDAAEAVQGADFVFVCVDTPPVPYSGDADLSRVWTVVEELPSVVGTPTLVMKSTVPVGTGEKVRAALDNRGLAHVAYVANPEFTAEGRALRDFMEPDRVILGAFDSDDADRVASLYESLDAPIVRMDVNSAEMVKLASNAFLMTRISFINEIANVCEATGADVVKVAEGVGLDKRLGPHFLRAGVGWGGSCFDGRETALVRLAGRTWLTSLAQLYELAEEGLPFEALSWREGGERPLFQPVSAVTRREYSGQIVELKTKMGRRIRVTEDHPLVTRTGVKLAREIQTDDWLPLALGTPEHDEPVELDLLEELRDVEVASVIVRTDAVTSVPKAQLRAALPHASRWRPHDIARTSALRLHELDALGLSLDGASLGTATNGTYVPASLQADRRFWFVVGLYIAEGHVTADGRRRRLQWTFHPTKEHDLVGAVHTFWTDCGVKATVRQGKTATTVSVSSRLLADWWLAVLGLGANSYVQRIPDAAWTENSDNKLALLAGMWRGDGSWSFVGGGPSVVLEYGTVSRELADGILRLLAERGIVARLKVGRTPKSTTDTYWLIVSGADQVESLLELVPRSDRETIQSSIARQARRIAPTGFRRDAGTAWVRVVDVRSVSYEGDVYSLEVPGTETVVSSTGLAVHNCFPKDSLALKQLAANSGYHFQLLNAVIEVNELQKRRVIGKLQRHLGKLRGKKIALLGLAFKAGTDDTREAPSLVLASRLIAEGAEVRAWDPVVDGRKLLPQAIFCTTVTDAVRDADAAVIVTEWPELGDLARPEIRDAMARPLIVDGRNLLDPSAVRAAGFAYEGIGRPVSPGDVLPEIPERQPELEQ